MSIQCSAITKNGSQCRKNASSADSLYCKRHAPAAETAPIITEDVTLTPASATPAAPEASQKPASQKDKARKAYESRQREKRQKIAQSHMSTQQKETARMLLAHETPAAPIITLDATRNDETIAAFDLALQTGDRHVRAITPADYNNRPRWLSDKDFKKCKRAFNTLYARDGESAFEKDQDGRLIMPLPMTPARYMGCVITGDISSVLRYAGGWRESEDGTFSMLARMDGVAPIIARVYRAGATLNRAAGALDKAQEKLDASDADSRDGLTTKRDLARVARDVARDGFIMAYRDAIASADSLDASARRMAADMLAQFATPAAPIISEDVNTDLVA